MGAGVKLAGLVALVLVAFAANSVLNRAAVGGGHIDALSFAVLRVVSGAIALVLLALLRDRRFRLSGAGGPGGALSLALYLIGFSLAYVGLNSGVGALILFGGVQVVMFAGALVAREPVPPLRWIGAAVALGGLVLLVWPEGGAAPPFGAALLMAAAAVGWGLYSLIGRRSGDPLRATAANFVLAVPPVALMLALPGFDGGITGAGAALAVVSGVVTSGCGYALWYAVLPRLSAALAALLQLLVPVLATAGGVLFLGEAVSLRLVLASALVLGGVALGVLASRRRG
ncbi:DMT family transporter [Oceaniglobus roseus]|uniref:DMT family transporter n=1 Tax=Oceaniglobus roseus TaxID=1737570 RepID=UPI000C7EF107|nr:DMT family transporter [Kandeliimicrobium roseum]